MHVYLESVYNHNVSLQTELDKGIHTHIIDHHALNIIHEVPCPFMKEMPIGRPIKYGIFLPMHRESLLLR